MSLNEDGRLDAEMRAILADELRLLLANPLFVRSPVLSRLLTYLVEHRLDDKGPAPKAYEIAIEALGRPADFDPSTDSYPRVMVGRLRSLMDKYYSEKPWLHRLRIPQGSYEVVVQYRTPPPGSGTSIKSPLPPAEPAVQPKTFVPLMPRGTQSGLSGTKLTPEAFLSDLALAPVAKEPPSSGGAEWKRRMWMIFAVMVASLLGGGAALLMDRYARSDRNIFSVIPSQSMEQPKLNMPPMSPPKRPDLDD